MHARIYQISLENKCEEDWINDELITDSDMAYYGIDYVCESDEREDDLQWLKDTLPTDMFSVNGNEITLLNDGADILASHFKKIKDYINGISEENYVNDTFPYDYKIKNLVNNILNIEHLFFIDDWSNCPTYSIDFIRYCHQRGKGTKFYVNGILDYHY